MLKEGNNFKHMMFTYQEVLGSNAAEFLLHYWVDVSLNTRSGEAGNGGSLEESGGAG